MGGGEGGSKPTLSNVISMNAHVALIIQSDILWITYQRIGSIFYRSVFLHNTATKVKFNIQHVLSSWCNKLWSINYLFAECSKYMHSPHPTPFLRLRDINKKKIVLWAQDSFFFVNNIFAIEGYRYSPTNFSYTVPYFDKYNVVLFLSYSAVLSHMRTVHCQ